MTPTRRFGLLAMLLAGMAGPVGAAGPIVFSPQAGTVASVSVKGSEVLLSVRRGKTVRSEKLQVETEQRLNVAVADYNFDGRKDFSVSHTDDGMGTQTISQIYVFSVAKQRFVPLRPACGDEFINLLRIKGRRSLVNSYVVDGQFKTCRMTF